MLPLHAEEAAADIDSTKGDAEEKIKARKRQLVGENQYPVTHSLPLHAEEASPDTGSPKGESAAIIAQKARVNPLKK